MMDHELCRAMG